MPQERSREYWLYPFFLVGLSIICLILFGCNNAPAESSRQAAQMATAPVLQPAQQGSSQSETAVKLILEVKKHVWNTDETVTVRLLALNESYEAVVVDRRLLIGPNLLPSTDRIPLPVEVEPAFEQEEQNQIILNPWGFYGRERTFSDLSAGQVTVYGYLLREPADALLPTGPVAPDALLVKAEPLTLTIQ